MTRSNFGCVQFEDKPPVTAAELNDAILAIEKALRAGELLENAIEVRVRNA